MSRVLRTGGEESGRTHPISYAVSGPRDAATVDLMLVHGWCCDRTAMTALRERLEQRHRVLTLDLRGHGQSQEFDEDGSVGAGARRADTVPPEPGTVATTIDAFSGDVLAVCAAEGLRSPVMIGHSMGGLVALDALSRADSPRREAPGRPWEPVGAVLLDPAPIAREKAKAFWAEQVGPVSRDHTGDLRREFARSLLLPTDRADYRSVVEVMASVHPEVAAGGANAMATFDGAAVLGQLSHPVLVIHAASAERGLEQLVPDRRLLTLGRTVGAGHFLHAEVPDQVIPMITRWLQVTVGVDAAG